VLLAEHDMSDYEGLAARNAELQAVQAEVEQLEHRWLELGELLGGDVDVRHGDARGVLPLLAQLGHVLDEVAEVLLAVVGELAHDDARDLAARLAPARLLVTEVDGGLDALPPALAAGALLGELLHVAVLLQLAEVVARRAARLAEPLGEHARGLRAVGRERVDDRDAKGMRESLEALEVCPAVRIVSHDCKDTLAKVSLQVLLCRKSFADRSLQRTVCSSAMLRLVGPRVNG